jgi:two-component system, LuxR family, response regulator FixJ
MQGEAETIFIIDDDKSVRRSLSLFLTAIDYHVEAYGSSEEFLCRESFAGTGCLLLDVNLEGKSGIELQEELIKQNSHLPIIFITGRGDIHMSVNALKKGAVNFLEKPFKDDELLQSVKEALSLSRKLKTEKEEARNAIRLIGTLTPRESEILKYTMSGMLNKQIASDLNIAEQTVKLHRHSICEKLGVKSVPEIIRIADKAGVIPFENKY